MPARIKRIGLQAVARAACVSAATVSKVLNTGTDRARFPEATRERVRAAARAVGYVPNYHAQSLQTGRAQAVGVAFPPLDSEYGLSGFWGKLISGVETAARGARCHTLVVGDQDGVDSVRLGLRCLRERRIDCLIVPGFHVEGTGALAELEAAGMPVVLAEYGGAATSLPVVRVDDTAAFPELAAHLAGLGHRHILWLAPDEEDFAYARRRGEALRHAARGFGLSVLSAVAHDRRNEAVAARVAAGRQALLTAWARPANRRSTAVVCCSEPLSFGAFAAAAETGLRVPGNLSIVGFDDQRAEIVYPPLTEISLRLDDVGVRATEVGLACLADPAAWRGRVVELPAVLHVRGSTGPRLVARRPPSRTARGTAR